VSMATLPPPVIEALIRRERVALVGRLLRGLVHNLSGGLQMVRLPLDLMELQAARGGETDLSQKLGAIQQGVMRLAHELETLANYSAALQRTSAETLDPAEVAAQQLELWRANMFFKHEAELDKDLPQGREKVTVAYADLALAFNQLMANALESLQAAGRRKLAVRLASQGDRVALAVSDDGPGPQPQVAESMFEPFVTDKGPEHDGLGLFLARAALAPWQGDVTWQPGQPCTFSLSLPRAQ